MLDDKIQRKLEGMFCGCVGTVVNCSIECR